MNELRWTGPVFLTACAFVGSLCSVLAGQTLGDVPFSGKGDLLQSLRISDEEERLREVNDLLHEFLVRGDQQTRSVATHYVVKFSRWFDFRPYEGVFREAEATHGDSTALYVLDLQNLSLGDRAERIDALAEALENGEIVLRRGNTLTRESAVRWVGREGIHDLKEPVKRVYPSLSDSFRGIYPLERFLMEFELAEGASDGEDAYVRSARCLLSMDRGLFVEKLTTDSFFAEHVVSLARRACELNPIDYSRNSACGDFVTLWSRESKTADESGVKRNEQQMWLQSLGHAVQDARISEPKL